MEGKGKPLSRFNLKHQKSNLCKQEKCLQILLFLRFSNKILNFE